MEQQRFYSFTHKRLQHSILRRERDDEGIGRYNGHTRPSISFLFHPSTLGTLVAKTKIRKTESGAHARDMYWRRNDASAWPSGEGSEAGLAERRKASVAKKARKSAK